MTESETHQPAAAPPCAHVCRGLLPLLPVRSRRELLCGLSRLWLEASGAGRALAFAPSFEEDRLLGSLAGPEGEPLSLECPLSNSDAPSPETFPALLTGRLDAECGVDVGESRLQTVPFGDGARGGGVVLFGELEAAAASELVGDLAELSARLIEQARLVEQGQNGPEARARLQAAKLEALAEFAAGAGHEINNPVATIAGRAQLLLRGETDPERRHALATIGGQAGRIRDMIGDLMLFGRPPAPNPEPLDLAEAVRGVLDRLQEQAASRGCTFELHVGSVGRVSNLPHVPIWADPVQLNVVISSLVQNSLEALSDGGTITVRAQSIEDRAASRAVLSVSDSGPGLSEKDREHLFDPFYSGRQAGRGLGFGLPKCWRIVSNHGGRIEVDSVPGAATTFTIHWPAATGQARRGKPAIRETVERGEH